MWRSQAAGDFAKSASTSTSLQMMALHDELVQRMKTVADADSAADDDNILSIVVFELSTAEPDLGRVELQRVDPDRLPVAPQRMPEKKPAVAIPASADSRRASNGISVNRLSQLVGQVPRRSPQQILCINKYGEKPGELKDPLGVACLPGGEIVVSEWGNRRLQLFDANGTSVRLIASGQVGISHRVCDEQTYCQ